MDHRLRRADLGQDHHRVRIDRSSGEAVRVHCARGRRVPAPRSRRIGRSHPVHPDRHVRERLSEGEAVVKWIGKVAASVNDVYENPYTGAAEAGAPAASAIVDLLSKIFGGMDRIGSFPTFFTSYELGQMTHFLNGSFPFILGGSHIYMHQSASYYVVGRIKRVD